MECLKTPMSSNRLLCLPSPKGHQTVLKRIQLAIASLMDDKSSGTPFQTNDGTRSDMPYLSGNWLSELRGTRKFVLRTARVYPTGTALGGAWAASGTGDRHTVPLQPRRT